MTTGRRVAPNSGAMRERDESVVVIRPSLGWVSLGLRELFAHRELLYFLIWRDIKVRYKQTVFGIGWAVIQPTLTMIVFTVVFGRLAKMPSDGIPYPLFSLAALVPWTFFANGMNTSAMSLVASSNLITKVYFPRLTIPLATVLAGAVDFVLSFGLLIVVMLYYGVGITVRVIWLPPIFVLALLSAVGVGLWLSAMNVQFRDVRYTIPLLTQLWLFATPVAYPSSLIPEAWRAVYGLNPMVGVIEGFRWALLNTETSPGPVLITSSLAAITLVVTGAFYFRRMEKTFADVV